MIGAIIALTDPRSGLAVGGASCLVAAVGGSWLARRYRRAGTRTLAAYPIVGSTDDDAADQQATALERDEAGTRA